MLYYLFNYLDQLDFPGAGMFKYVSFRSGLALILSLFISTAIGRRIIDKLQLLQIGETVRNLGLEGQMSKKGTTVSLEKTRNPNDGWNHYHYCHFDTGSFLCSVGKYLCALDACHDTVVRWFGFCR